MNHISYTPHICNNTGECLGTCIMCDAESKWLLSVMKELENKGFPISYSLLDSHKLHSGTGNIECVPYFLYYNCNE